MVTSKYSKERERDDDDERDVLLNKPMVHFKGGGGGGGGGTFEKLMRHPKRMLQKQMKLQYIQNIYSSVHFSFVPSIAH